jgi:NADPH:quinone reductase-like Zn-dependent oxidoreductase
VKAARIHRYGAPSVITYDDIPTPQPGPDEVLIDVTATSFNPTETALRAGLLLVDLPYTLGWDVAGTVNGEPMIGMLDGGAAAQCATAPTSHLVTAPKTIPLSHAAAIPLAGMTAWQTVFEHADVVAGQRVLVNGAGGGIGGFTVQLAKYAGAHVIATASPRSADTVRAQGADQVIDYTVTPVAEALDAPVDTVLNIAGFTPEQAAALAERIRPGGVVIDVSVPFQLLPDSHVTARHMVTRNDVTDLAALVKLVDEGALAVNVTGSYSVADLAEVHRRGEAGQINGKVIVLP